MTKRLINQGKRVFDGNFAPGMVGIFSDIQADKYLRGYPKEIVDIDNIKISFDQSKVQDFSVKAVKITKKSKTVAAADSTPPDDTKLAQALKA